MYDTKDSSGSVWYFISYVDETGTYNGYIPASEVTLNMTGKVVKTKTVNVRKSPRITAKRVTTLKKNKKVTVFETKKKKGVTWYHVTFEKNDEEYTGWISAPYLKLQ
jgi:uncharacterized protein YgiM (DUF1202 family)